MRVKIKNAEFSCAVANSTQEYEKGLQHRVSLAQNEGMLFIFPRTRSASFHQAKVTYPLDILGISEDSRINRIVENTRPGSDNVWSFHNVAAVLELNGGSCRKAPIDIGDVVSIEQNGKSHQANLLEKEDAEATIENHPSYVLNSHESVDASANDNAKNKYWHDLLPDELANELLEPNIPVTRHSHVRVAQIVDEAKFVEKVADVIFGKTDELKWTPDALNGDMTERAVVTRQDLARWLSGEVNTGSLKQILSAAGDEKGLELIGSAFVLSGQADFTRLGYANKTPMLVLYRARD